MQPSRREAVKYAGFYIHGDDHNNSEREEPLVEHAEPPQLRGAHAPKALVLHPEYDTLHLAVKSQQKEIHRIHEHLTHLREHVTATHHAVKKVESKIRAYPEKKYVSDVATRINALERSLTKAQQTVDTLDKNVRVLKVFAGTVAKPAAAVQNSDHIIPVLRMIAERLEGQIGGEITEHFDHRASPAKKQPKPWLRPLRPSREPDMPEMPEDLTAAMAELFGNGRTVETGTIQAALGAWFDARTLQQPKTPSMTALTNWFGGRPIDEYALNTIVNIAPLAALAARYQNEEHQLRALTKRYMQVLRYLDGKPRNRDAFHVRLAAHHIGEEIDLAKSNKNIMSLDEIQRKLDDLEEHTF